MPEITSDQALMRDNARRLFTSGEGLARPRLAAKRWPDVDRTLWNEFAAMGWMSLLLADDDRGMGGDASDFAVLMEALGDLLPPEPVGPALATVPLLAACATEPAERLLAAALTGERIVLAATEGQPSLQTAATHVVPDAHWADTLVFGLEGADGFVVRAIDVSQAGDSLSIARTVDGGSLGLAAMDPSRGYQIGAGEQLRTAFARCRNMQRLGAAAGLVGLAQESLRITVEYLKLRRQFGVAIGSFQALQHRAASMHVGCQSTRALVYEAARTVGTATEELACAAAKAKASETAMKVVKESVQLHGAIGFSDESDVALFFRRAVALSAAYGSPEICRRAVFARGAASA